MGEHEWLLWSSDMGSSSMNVESVGIHDAPTLLSSAAVRIAHVHDAKEKQRKCSQLPKLLSTALTKKRCEVIV